ncbi:MAG: hypothetical protein INR67_18710 [Jatrophihabitans endophyticus]|nr:hypothetical protein [Jatrophihabitans endophyticus]
MTDNARVDLDTRDWHRAGTGLPELRMFVDYGCRSPLWMRADDGGGRGVPLEALPLPGDLRAALRAWCRFFDENYDWQTGWTNPRTEALFADMGRGLYERTARVLQGRFTVVPRFE